MYIPLLEAHLGYLAATVIIVVGGAAALGYLHVRHETRPVELPVVTQTGRRVAPGDLCTCGGIIGRISDRSGDLLGCSGCNRAWTLDGRRASRR